MLNKKRNSLKIWNNTHREKSLLFFSGVECWSKNRSLYLVLCPVAYSVAPHMPRKHILETVLFFLWNLVRYWQRWRADVLTSGAFLWLSQKGYFSPWRAGLYITIFFKRKACLQVIWQEISPSGSTGGKREGKLYKITDCVLCCQPQCKIHISKMNRFKTYAVEMKQLKRLI